MPDVGDLAPPFTMPSTHGAINLHGLLTRGKKVVLAFYTEDSTPTCTQEVCSLRDEYQTLQDLNAIVVAVSADSVESHEGFCEQLGGCPFPLATDRDLKVASRYDVVAEDGKRSRRAMFVIDERGTIIYKNPYYQPSNPAQLLDVFQALGLE